MDEMTHAIHFFENSTKLKIFSIRPLDEKEHEHGIYLVNREYVVRMYRPRAGDPYLPARHGEGDYVFHDYDPKTHLAIPPLFVYDRHGNKIEMYLGPTYAFQDMTDRKRTLEEITMALRAVAALQQQKITKDHCDIIERFYKYKKISGKNLPEGFERMIIDRTKRLIEAEPLVLTHRHLKGENIVLRDDTAYLLDLRFCGPCCPLLDVASICEENGFDSVTSREALRIYQNFRPSSRIYTYEDLTVLMLFLDAFWYYWAMAQSTFVQRPRYLDLAAKKKAHFLFVFDAYCVEGKL